MSSTPSPNNRGGIGGGGPTTPSNKGGRASSNNNNNSNQRRGPPGSGGSNRTNNNNSTGGGGRGGRGGGGGRSSSSNNPNYYRGDGANNNGGGGRGGGRGRGGGGSNNNNNHNNTRDTHSNNRQDDDYTKPITIAARPPPGFPAAAAAASPKTPKTNSTTIDMSILLDALLPVTTTTSTRDGGFCTRTAHDSLSPKQPIATDSVVKASTNAAVTTTTTTTPAAKRLWVLPEEQPGSITVNGYTKDPTIMIPYGPREELVANWIVPISYFIERYHQKLQQDENHSNNNVVVVEDGEPIPFSLDVALRGLCIGLFRRGCNENGSTASIITKSVTEFQYRANPNTNTIIGRVPFYTPRTPGNVIFRMYYDHDPIYTIAIGPTIRVRVLENDFDSSIRFVLSNFNKSRTGGGTSSSTPSYAPAVTTSTSLSSLHSLASILETTLNSIQQQQQQANQHQQQQRGRYDNNNSNNSSSIARSVWGCIQESRKVIQACFAEYCKATNKLNELEEQIDELKLQLQQEQQEQAATKNGENTNDSGIVVPDSLFSLNDDDLLMPGSPDGFIPDTPRFGKQQSSGGDNATNKSSSLLQSTISDKVRTLMTGRASCERKWRDSQSAFATILKVLVTNPSMTILLRRDTIMKLSLEYELWCPISEEFAIPGKNYRSTEANNSNSNNNTSITESASKDTNKIRSTRLPPEQPWYEIMGLEANAGGNKQHQQLSITSDDFYLYSQARIQMQRRNLGFDLNTMRLENVLYPPYRNSDGTTTGNTNNKNMDPRAVNVLNGLSNAMGQFYQELHINETTVLHQRERIRSITQQCVTNCGAFPPGTEVVIFGSSANGFGSPQSDIDMCLQLPPGVTLENITSSIEPENNNNTASNEGGNATAQTKAGSAAMAKFAEYLAATTNMKGIDTARLTARIPIVKFLCPIRLDGQTPVTNDNDDDDDDDSNYVECDLSMHNPLAVMNTSFLRTYATITPVTRVLMATIKRWAKARDINSPSHHTLSSYGYTIMLLHFLTFHKRAGNGLVIPVAPPEGITNKNISNNNNNHTPDQVTQLATPLLPNLHWMDPRWMGGANSYAELLSLPKKIIQHPFNEKTKVNTYYFTPKTINEGTYLQRAFANQDLSLAILLASFFRYYAYEFDYKRSVVSLHSTAAKGVVERETKAELHGWRNYSVALAIEDPFELDYDIAHVLRGGGFHRIRREFALAYTKIVDAASGRQCSWHPKAGQKQVVDGSTGSSTTIITKDIHTMSGNDLLEWICEPVPTVSSSATKEEPTLIEDPAL